MAHHIDGAGQVGKEVRKAVAYLRTSSKANVGADKDSDKRQRAAIEAYANAAGYEIVETFYDAAVSGADTVGDRPGVAEMLERPLSNGALGGAHRHQCLGRPAHDARRGRVCSPAAAIAITSRRRSTA
jgi:hypothetical protein